MIQSILFFVLGFLVAGFIALLLAPAMLRRASKLTTRRLEASLPQTPAEIRADKDRIRAEAAMTIRRLEVETAQAREKATTQLVDISRGLEQIKALANDCDDKAKTIAELEARVETQEADLARQSELCRNCPNNSRRPRRQRPRIMRRWKSWASCMTRPA
ncbi:hypothetical protein [Pseudaminobacter salicylatoxidans]|uniref:hypothetical protein n=1 Tax=Pseudaminobacter salicylatoxidans TaxID=93369 RepID=UPI0002DDA354